MRHIPSMYRKLKRVAQALEDRDRKSNEEIARRLRFTKKEIRKAMDDLKRFW